MKTFLDCVPCFVRQTLAILYRSGCDEKVQEEVLRDVLRLLSEIDLASSPPAMGRQIFRHVGKYAKSGDVYFAEKRALNECALSLVADMERICRAGGGDAFERLVRMALAGNIMDLGVHQSIDKAAVMLCIERCLDAEIDRGAVHELQQLVREADTILYLGDNAGEIVFDRMLIAHMPCQKITYVVRGAPVINDVTMEDARQAGMLGLVRVIDNGSDAPGTILDDCSDDFCRAFEAADLVIAKGQGNYETLTGIDKNIVFLLQAKCQVIARDIGCATGSFVVKVNRKRTSCRVCAESTRGAQS